MKKVLILFNGANLSYSPTVIGLYDRLAERFDVTVIAESPKTFDNQPLTGRRVVYKREMPGKNNLKFRSLLYRFASLYDRDVARLRKMGMKAHVIFDFKQIRACIEEIRPDFIIAVDFNNLLYTQVLGKRAEFLSLEIIPGDEFYANCDFSNINSVIIQTPDRCEHLFGDRRFRTFFVQNAPVYTPFSGEPERKSLVYCGTAWDPFGFFHCLEFLRRYPEYAMHVKGALLGDAKARVETEYRELIDEKRLVIDSRYLDDAEVVNYLRGFRAGFCFYNFELDRINNFNYRTAPSGKMFKYFAAGVPVIGQQIPGLQPVAEFDCGVLINDLQPETIKKAVERAEANFERFSENCLKAARHYSFDKTVQPFINYLAGKD